MVAASSMPTTHKVTGVGGGGGGVKTDETVASCPLFVAFVNDSTWQFDAGLPCLMLK